MTPPTANLKAFSLRGVSSTTIWSFTPSCVAVVVGCVSTAILPLQEKTSLRDSRDVDTQTDNVSCKPHSLQWPALVAASHNFYSPAGLKCSIGRRRGSYLPPGKPTFVLG